MFKSIIKTCFAVGLCLGVAGFGVTPASAAECEGAKVVLLTAQAESAYRAEDVDIEYVEDDFANTYTAIVIDQETGKVLESYSETPDIPIDELRAIRSGESSTKAVHNYNTKLSRNVTLERPGGKSIDAYTWVEVNVTADFSWAQIERVNAKGHQAGNSGAYRLNSASTIVRTTSFPCNTVSVQIHGMIEVTSSNGIGISFGSLSGLGFSMSGSSTSTWTARKAYDAMTSFSIM